MRLQNKGAAVSLFSNICQWALTTITDAGKKAAVQELADISQQLAAVIAKQAPQMHVMAQPLIDQAVSHAIAGILTKK